MQYVRVYKNVANKLIYSVVNDGADLNDVNLRFEAVAVWRSTRRKLKYKKWDLTKVALNLTPVGLYTMAQWEGKEGVSAKLFDEHKKKSISLAKYLKAKGVTVNE